MSTPPRLYCPIPLVADQCVALPQAAAKHVQVLRLQPGHLVTLFGHDHGQWLATIEEIGRSHVTVRSQTFAPISRETRLAVHLVIGLVANDRMDYLIEKATELGVASFLPLDTERCVVKLSGDRADRRRQHWQAVASSACEQCGRNTIPPVYPVQPLSKYMLSLSSESPSRTARYLLSLSDRADPLIRLTNAASFQTNVHISLLSGPEGGWSSAEEALLVKAGHRQVSLGPRTLRADTAPLAALAVLTMET